MNVHVWLLRKFRKIRKWILKIEIQLFMNRKPTKKKRKEAFSSSSETPKLIIRPNLAWTRIYGIACWVKYLVDSSENIWGCLNESMFVVVAHHELVHTFERMSSTWFARSKLWTNGPTSSCTRTSRCHRRSSSEEDSDPPLPLPLTPPPDLPCYLSSYSSSPFGLARLSLAFPQVWTKA